MKAGMSVGLHDKTGVKPNLTDNQPSKSRILVDLGINLKKQHICRTVV